MVYEPCDKHMFGVLKERNDIFMSFYTESSADDKEDGDESDLSAIR